MWITKLFHYKISQTFTGPICNPCRLECLTVPINEKCKTVSKTEDGDALEHIKSTEYADIQPYYLFIWS